MHDEDIVVLRQELVSGRFFWKMLICSWKHRVVWTQLNDLGNNEWVQVSGRCYPHCDHECEIWHCTRCHPCGEELDKLFKKI